MSAEFKHVTLWCGNTYPHRDYIRSLGGHWDAERKVWVVPPMTMRERSACRVPRGVTVTIKG